MAKLGIRCFRLNSKRLAELSQQEFSAVFRGSAVKRAKWRGLVRNACVALGNSGVEKSAAAYPRVIRLLDRLAVSEDSLIAEHANGRVRGYARGRRLKLPAPYA